MEEKQKEEVRRNNQNEIQSEPRPVGDGVLSHLMKRERNEKTVLSDASHASLFSNYYKDYFRPKLHTTNLSGVFSFNNKEENGTTLAVGTVAASLVVVSLARDSSSSRPFFLPKNSPKDCFTPILVHSQPTYHSNWINSIVWSQDDRHIYSCSDDGSISIFDVTSLRRLDQIPFITSSLRGISTAKDDPSSLVFGAGKQVAFWDKRQKESPRFFLGHQEIVTDTVTSSDGLMILSSSFDGSIRVWDTRSSAQSLAVIAENFNHKAVTSLAFDRSEKRILVNSETNIVSLFDLSSLGDAPSGATLSLAENTNQPNVWTLPTKRFTGHKNQSYLKKATFSPDDELIISGSDTHSSIMWSVASGQIVAELPLPLLSTDFSVINASISPFYSNPITVTSTDNSLTVYTYNPNRIPRKEDEKIDNLGDEVERILDSGHNDEDIELLDVLGEDESSEEAIIDDEQDHGTPGVCFYDRGYTNQHVFVCKTCTPETSAKDAGVCRQCAGSCHESQGHQVVDLGPRDFRCDCGNSKFDSPCQLKPVKDAVNSNNQYNHNFKLRYCACDQPDDGELMIQCSHCYEWFHHHCLGVSNQEEDTRGTDFLCTNCIEKAYSFLKSYPTEDQNNANKNTSLREKPVESEEVDIGDDKPKSKDAEDEVDILNDTPQSKPQNSASSLQQQNGNAASQEKRFLGRNCRLGRILPSLWLTSLTPEDAAVAESVKPPTRSQPPASATNMIPPTVSTAPALSSPIWTNARELPLTSIRSRSNGSSSSMSSSTSSITPATSTAPGSQSSISPTNEALEVDNQPPQSPNPELSIDEQIMQAVANRDVETARKLVMRKLVQETLLRSQSNRRGIITTQDAQQVIAGFSLPRPARQGAEDDQNEQPETVGEKQTNGTGHGDHKSSEKKRKREEKEEEEVDVDTPENSPPQSSPFKKQRANQDQEEDVSITD